MENKKAYIKPVLESETFVPQCYCNQCGVHGQKVYFECNASHLIGGAGGVVYLETNNTPGLQLPDRHDNADTKLSSYTPCSEKHITDRTDVFLKGYISWGLVERLATPVLIWRGIDGQNTHCTTNLKIDEWETVKS